MPSPLVEWKPLLEPTDGYTMIVGINPGLLGMLDANLRFLARQDLSFRLKTDFPNLAAYVCLLDARTVGTGGTNATRSCAARSGSVSRRD